MLFYLYGKVNEVTLTNVVLEIGDIGFLIYVKRNSKFKIGENYKFFVYDIIKENENISLYGFLDKDELLLFKKLIKVNGIGPSGAMQIISNCPLNLLISYINTGDIVSLNKIKGMMGRGQSIVYQLKNKLKEFNVNLLHYENVIDALLSLNYTDAEINEAISKIENNLSDGDALKKCIWLINNERNK